MLLFCYGALQRNTGPANVEKLRAEIPRLFKLAKLVRAKPVKGIAALKPPNSDAHDEQYVFDFVGMLGLPLVPTAKIDTDAKAAFFSVQALKDTQFGDKLRRMLAAGKPVLITDGLADRLDGIDLDAGNPTILKVGGKPRGLLELSREQLRPMRKKMLAPFGMSFDAPNRVALYLIGHNCIIVENFNDEAVNASLELPKPVEAKVALILPGEGSVDFTCAGRKLSLAEITPRTLIAFKY